MTETRTAICGECLSEQDAYQDPDGDWRLDSHETPHGYECGLSGSIVEEW